MALLTKSFADARPDTPAVVDGSGTTTWADLDRRVDRLVHALRERGLGEGATVALMAGNQREAIEVTLACLHGGWLVVPVNWHWVAPELEHVLADSDAAALVVAAEWIDVAANVARPAVCIVVGAGDAESPDGFEDYEEVLDAAADGEPADQVRGGPMFYTSGTTGFPKGVKGVLGQTGGGVEMWQLLSAGIGATIELAPADPVLLLCGPMYHSAQWVFTFASLLGGATVVLQHRFDPVAVLDAIDEHRVTNLHLVPAQMVRLLRVPDEVRTHFDGSTLSRVHHGAAPCPEAVKRALIDWWGPIVYEYYGGTEGGFITMATSEDWAQRPGTVGRQVSIMEVLVLDANGAPVPTGEVGDVCFRSILGSSFEYHKAPDKTEAAHRGPGVGTLGDVGYLDDDGYLFLCDRRIDMVISGGVNIYPAEIERVLGGHASVADVAVFGVPHDEMGEQVMAVIEPAGAVDETSLFAALEALCRDSLAGYKCPRRWELADRLPRSESGKLQKRLLRDPYWADADRSI